MDGIFLSSDKKDRIHWRSFKKLKIKSKLILQRFITFHQIDIGMGHVFREFGCSDSNARNFIQVGLRADAGAGRHIEFGRQILTINNRVMADHGTVTHFTVEQYGIKTDEDAVTDFARAMDDRTVGDRTVFANRYGGTGFGVDHHAILNIGISADHNRFHLTVCIHFIGTDHCIRTDENVIFDDDLAADNRGFVDIS